MDGGPAAIGRQGPLEGVSLCDTRVSAPLADFAIARPCSRRRSSRSLRRRANLHYRVAPCELAPNICYQPPIQCEWV